MNQETRNKIAEIIKNNAYKEGMLMGCIKYSVIFELADLFERDDKKEMCGFCGSKARFRGYFDRKQFLEDCRVENKMKKKYTIWFEQINADVYHNIEAENEEEAKKEAIRLWKIDWQPHISDIREVKT